MLFTRLLCVGEHVVSAVLASALSLARRIRPRVFLFTRAQVNPCPAPERFAREGRPAPALVRVRLGILLLRRIEWGGGGPQKALLACVLLRAKDRIKDGIVVQLAPVDEAEVHLELHACGLQRQGGRGRPGCRCVARRQRQLLCCDARAASADLGRPSRLWRGIPPTL